MKRTIFFIACLSLLAVCLTSCGSTDNLRTIQLTGSSSNLQGIGATIQLQAQGTYAYGPNRDLTNLVTYTIIVDPDSNLGLGAAWHASHSAHATANCNGQRYRPGNGC